MAETSDTAVHIGNSTLQRHSEPTAADSGRSGMIESQAPQDFDVDISSRRQLNELQRLEKTHGRAVHDWLDEGMPREVMGNPREMRAFRTRQPTPAPWNTEVKNKQSVQRSTEMAADTSPTGETRAPDSVREVISSRGHCLDGTVQRMLEDEIDDSFGDVQIHTGATAATACESINARAFTVGNHIAFDHGEYDPASPAGQHVIAHEPAHVRQQTGGAVSMLPRDRETDPDPQLERRAESTDRRVIRENTRDIQRLKDTAADGTQSTQLPIGNPKVPESVRPVVDSRELVDSRKERLQAAVQQRGPSCMLAMLQAYLVHEGRDTTSLVQILRNYPRDFETGNMLTDSRFDIKDLLRVNLLRFTQETREYILNTLDTIVNTAESTTNRDWQRHFQSKGIACALGKVYQDKNKKGELETPEQKQQDEVLTTGKNLLKRAQKGSYGLYPIRKTLRGRFETTECIKRAFLIAVTRLKTPMAVSMPGSYNTLLPEDNPLEDERPGHVYLVYGVWIDDSGTVFVSYRNGRDPDGVTQDLEINKFFSPVQTETVDALKHKNDYCRDVDRRIGWAVDSLSMDCEVANEQISKPIDAEDVADSDFHSATEDEDESLLDIPPELFEKDVLTQFKRLAAS